MKILKTGEEGLCSQGTVLGCRSLKVVNVCTGARRGPLHGLVPGSGRLSIRPAQCQGQQRFCESKDPHYRYLRDGQNC